MKNAICVLQPEYYNKKSVLYIDEIYHLKKIIGLRIYGTVYNLKPGFHGFHIHEYGDLTEGCKSLCMHFNPLNETHGGLHSKHRHLGDLGNIYANQEGIATVDIFESQLRLDGLYSILGRSIVVHEKKDDLGRGGNKESLITGNSGKRIYCGIIGLRKNESF